MKLKNIIKEYVFPYFGIAFGSVIAAFALEEFLVPNTILDGGITGISIMISTLTDWPLGLFILLLNIPFMFMGLK
ncbi:MAG: YitT family protein, partial [Eubacterium sp.]|nr:YitT family protein [Eubacterium sp.]